VLWQAACLVLVLVWQSTAAASASMKRQDQKQTMRVLTRKVYALIFIEGGVVVPMQLMYAQRRGAPRLALSRRCPVEYCIPLAVMRCAFAVMSC